MSTSPAMEFLQAVPPGPAVGPETLYTGMDLAARALSDRPYLVCNFAASADGKATVDGTSGALGGDGDKMVFRLLRTQVDAVLAGTGTLAAERYGALVTNDRMLAIRAAEGRAAQPLAVTVSRSGNVPFDIPLFADPGARIVIFVPPGTAVPDGAAHVAVHPCPDGPDPLTECPGHPAARSRRGLGPVRGRPAPVRRAAGRGNWSTSCSSRWPRPWSAGANGR